MSLVRHEKSPYWYASFMVNGKAIFRSTKTNNKALAQKIENEMRRKEIEDHHFEPKGVVTLKWIVTFYVDSRKDKGSSKTDKTYSNKLLGFKTDAKSKKPTPVFGFDPTMEFNNLTTKHLFQLVAARKSERNSIGTIIQELQFIAGLVTTAKLLGYKLPDINIKDFKKSQRIKITKKPIRFLTADEEKRLLDELEPTKSVWGMAEWDDLSDEMKRIRQDAYDFVIVLLDTGARYSEISLLNWDQVNLDTRTIHVIRGKVDNDSYLHMTDRLYAVLLRRSENKNSIDYVFTARDGGPRNYNPRALMSAIKRAGIKNCSYHTMRKTLASKLVQGGLAISDVSAILGHASVTTTANFYASLAPSASSKRALAILNSGPE